GRPGRAAASPARRAATRPGLRAARGSRRRSAARRRRESERAAAADGRDTEASVTAGCAATYLLSAEVDPGEWIGSDRARDVSLHLFLQPNRRPLAALR